MKGTIDASLPDAERRLLADEKELREHNTIVDLIRNDLSSAASEVRVRRFRFPSAVRRFGRADIIQTSSEICGKLRVPLGDALRSMLPAGSICGAPKPKTLEILRECESVRRGFYTGIFGYFDSENFDSAVAIRFVERGGGKTYFRSGGGITALSGAVAEYAEVTEKIYIPLRPKPRFLETIKVCDGKILSPGIHYDRYKKNARRVLSARSPRPDGTLFGNGARRGRGRLQTAGRIWRELFGDNRAVCSQENKFAQSARRRRNRLPFQVG